MAGPSFARLMLALRSTMLTQVITHVFSQMDAVEVEDDI